MVKVINQFIPGIWEALYGKGIKTAFNDGFTYYLHGYTDLPTKIVRSK